MCSNFFGMSFKINLFSVVFLFNILSISAQDIAIPFRDGEKWGMCNQDGKILIEPKYDQLKFEEGYSESQEIFRPKLKNKTGLIKNGKVLFEAIYSNIYEKNGNYILVLEDNNEKRTDIVNSDGKSILKKPIIDILDSNYINSSLTAYQVLNTDFTESVFIYDNTNHEIVQWLYENYFSLTVLDKQSDRTSVVFTVKKLEKDALTTEAWDFSKLPKEKIRAEILSHSESEYFKRFVEKSYKYNRENGSGSGSGHQGSSDGYYVTDDIKADRDYDMIVEAPTEIGNSTNRKPITYYSHSFKIAENQLVFEKSNQYHSKEKKTTVSVKLKVPVSNIEIKNYHSSLKKNDTINYFNNFIFYKKKEKQGVLFTADTKKIIEFDTINKSIDAVNNYDGDSEIVLVVGNKDKKTNKFKYSFYSSAKGLLFPLHFDELTATKIYTNQGSVTYLSKMGNKFGLIQINGQELLKPEYDELKQPPYSSAYSGQVKKLYQTKKNNKFGMVVQNKDNNKLEIIDAVFDYPIGEIYTNYPKQEYKKGENSSTLPKITLLSLKDKNGIIKGYANANGTLYYKN